THKGVCGQQYKNDQLVAAVKLDNKDLCGKKVEVTGPNNSTIEVTIVDGCKTCEENDLDLSPAAFEKLGEFSHATIPISWKFV
ncbi:hypothetical protein K501DRAFT_142076, partial [Backusella circina FSU 941]